MKKIFTIILLFVAISSIAQTKIKSMALADSIWINKGAFEINPVIVTAQGDTARSMAWSSHLQRDSTAPVFLQIILFNKSGSQVALLPTPINTWSGGHSRLIFKIDSILLKQNPRFTKP